MDGRAPKRRYQAASAGRPPRQSRAAMAQVEIAERATNARSARRRSGRRGSPSSAPRARRAPGRLRPLRLDDVRRCRRCSGRSRASYTIATAASMTPSAVASSVNVSQSRGFLGIKPAAGAVVEIAADHPAVVERRTVRRARGGGSCQAGSAPSGMVPGSSGFRSPAPARPASELARLVQRHQDLAHEGRRRRMIEAHAVQPARRSRTRPRPANSTSTFGPPRTRITRRKSRAAVHAALGLGAVRVAGDAVGKAIEGALVRHVLRLGGASRGVGGNRDHRADAERGPGERRQGDDGQRLSPPRRAAPSRL